MAKRSPILGYNHNVLYRGLIFHVQTEDSGLMSPHLFTHLFYSGVIISSRKLVYDAGSDEGAIKSLMQAQHKAVMKDLKRQVFDDKIDQYLVGTPGLLPRGAAAAAAEAPTRDSEPALTPPAPAVPVPVLEDSTSQNETQPIDVIELVPPIAIARTATPPPIPARAATPPPIPVAAKSRPDTELDPKPLGTLARTFTPERVSPPRQAPPPPPSLDELDAPTYSDSTAASISAAIAAANAHTLGQNDSLRDSSPEIEIQLELDEPDDDTGRRQSRDTDVASLPDPIAPRANSDSVQPLPPPPVASTPYTPPHRPSSVVGASLPAARPVTRPPSRPHITQPGVQPASLSSGVVARPVDRNNELSEPVDIYAPAPPSVEPPPGMLPERPGQYAQHRRPPRLPTESKSGSIPIPAGLGRPGRASVVPTPAVGVPTRSPTGQQASISGSSAGIPVPIAPHTTEPIASRANTANRGTPASSMKPSTSGGVVMTRPAVIVGAPTKQTAALPRVRKAREDEGRGFGQGLISEKSLDEVILAYLSEDADDK